MKTKTQLFLIALIVGNLVIVAYGVYKAMVVIPTDGQIEDYELTVDPTSINWGSSVTLDTPVIKTVSLSNTGTDLLNNLNLTTQNVVGLLVFSVTWDLEGSTILAGETVTAEFTLTVQTYSQKNFSLDLVVTGD